jgi:hypothetical protein
MAKGKVDIITQLMGLKALTAQFGMLHELQLQHLKRWSWAIDPNIKDTPVIEIDSENKLINFNIICDKCCIITQKYKKHYQNLLKHVRFMLGDDWQIVICRNNETIFSKEDCQNPPIINGSPKQKPSNRRNRRSRSRKR